MDRVTECARLILLIFDILTPTAICVEIEREGRQITPVQLEKEYQDWLKAMHESYDEEVECGDGEATLILNPSNGKGLGISNKGKKDHLFIEVGLFYIFKYNGRVIVFLKVLKCATFWFVSLPKMIL